MAGGGNIITYYKKPRELRSEMAWTCKENVKGEMAQILYT